MFPAPVDTIEYARSVREDTAELASYFLSDQKSPVPLNRPRSQSSTVRRNSWRSDDDDDDDDYDNDSERHVSETIVEVSEPPSPDEQEDISTHEDGGPSMLTNMLRKSPPESYRDQPILDQEFNAAGFRTVTRDDNSSMLWQADEAVPFEDPTEDTPLLKTKSHASSHHNRQHGNGAVNTNDVDIEGQKRLGPRHWLSERVHRLRDFGSSATVPSSKAWNGQAVVQAVVVDPVKALPAVFVGLILNILDALSYGMILFPLGDPIFANLGPAGISIFYVSTIVSQVVFSTGSIFKGGVGSELIEVVPFFHNMASTITSIVGRENPDAVIATTIFCFSFSSLITGAVFFAMGALKFGYLVGFIPRHILIGCIGVSHCSRPIMAGGHVLK